MSFPKYPEVKDSGVEWLGEVPVHWKVLPLKAQFQVVGGSTPSADEEHWGGPVTWVTPADLSSLPSLEVGSSLRQITEKGLASCGATLVPSGSLVLSTRAPIGSLAIASVPLCTNQGCKSLVPAKGKEARFFAYLLRNCTEALNVRGKGTTFLEISGDELSSFKVTVPPQDEQAIIARFLDYETARIDALVEEQKRLIELLREKRQAVISHAVTKGLDPDVPMKDSGVEWLGEVPTYWRVVSLRWLIRCSSGEAISKNEFYEEDAAERFPVVGGNGVIGYCEKNNVAEDSIIIGRVGALCGNAHHVSSPSWVTDNALWVEIDRTCLSPKFLKLVLIARSLNDLATKTAQPLITSSQIKDQKVALPPLEEQASISDWLDAELSKIDGLIQQANKNTSLLSERRSALISAAVTGKIDVRGWQPPRQTTSSREQSTSTETV